MPRLTKSELDRKAVFRISYRGRYIHVRAVIRSLGRGSGLARPRSPSRELLDLRWRELVVTAGAGAIGPDRPHVAVVATLD
jgi:hypothetical protein